MDRTPSKDYDAIVIGGGPAGAVAGARLAQRGRRVLIVERDRFPRYHIGESLLSATMPILEELGVAAKIAAAGFVEKPGGTFLWGNGETPWRFEFAEDPGGRPHAYHVVRAEFDQILLRHAESLGAEVREEHRATAVRYDGELATVRVEAAGGGHFEARAPFAVDASGQSALLGRRDGLRQIDPFFKNIALFSYFKGAHALDGQDRGNIFSVAFADGWCWFIPLHDGTTSVGVVVDVDRFAQRADTDLASAYTDLLARCGPVAARLRDAKQVAPVRCIRDYSYSSQRFFGPGYLLAGDAACFIDPVFSTGVHLACLSGWYAAAAIDRALSSGDRDPEMDAYDRRYRAAYDRYLQFLYFFYDHHHDAESYFWQARKILGSTSAIDHRQAFVRLVSGGADLTNEAVEDLQTDLDRRHDRFRSATSRGRFAASGAADLFRVRATRSEIDGD